MLCNPEAVQELINKELHLGHMLGLFERPPLPDLVYYLINIVPKAGPTKKWQLIHNLAYPYNTDQSMNSCFLEKNSKVEYHQIDEVIQMALALGTVAKGTRCYIKVAFRNQGIMVQRYI